MPQESSMTQRVQAWADGKSTLREVRGYSEEELYSIARTGYFFFYQGKIEEARVVFQGLYAIDPAEPYYARALGVVEMASGNPTGAIAAYDVAVKMAPYEAAGYLGRAEVKLLQGHREQAIEDLKRAKEHSAPDSAEGLKIVAMLERLSSVEK